MYQLNKIQVNALNLLFKKHFIVHQIQIILVYLNLIILNEYKINTTYIIQISIPSANHKTFT